MAKPSSLFLIALAIVHTSCTSKTVRVTPAPEDDGGATGDQLDAHTPEASTADTSTSSGVESPADASDGSTLPSTSPDAGIDAGGDAGALYCGEFVRVDTDDRGEIPDYVRIRDEAALAARQWACVAETPAGDSLDAGADAASITVDAGALDAAAQSPNTSAQAPDFLSELGCEADFQLMASHTAAGSSVKVLVDRFAPRADGEEFPIYFINSERYGLHYDFAADPNHLNVGPRGELPSVGTLAEFNSTEYTSPSRRFLLGALTYYADADTWAYELAPNDAATSDLILTAWDLVEKHVWVGSEMKLHTTSDAIAVVAQTLPEDVDAVPTADLINQTYQPLNEAESFGRLRFITAQELADQTKYVDFQDIVVLDHVPNDISVTLGIITSDFQTPLAHINVLSQNRGTPNMALKGAFEDPTLRALENQWVRLKVSQDAYELEAVDPQIAADWWESHRPSVVAVPRVDKETTELRTIEKLVDLEKDSVHTAVKNATITYGGKAAHYAVLRHIEGVPVEPAFGIPVHYYFEFMKQHGFDQHVEALLADPDFQNSPEVRDERLNELRDWIKQAPVDPEFMATLRAKLNAEFPGQRMRFRSSTNAEDLEGFTGAGLYTSKSGDESGRNPLDDAEKTFDNAIRKVWASVWNFRAFEERRYRGIEHKDVGMALLVHRSFPDEYANGVALTNNPYDKTGAFPAFYVNVQRGEGSVVLPDPGTTTDAYLQHWDAEGQRTQYFSYSNSTLVGPKETVLTTSQISELGAALAKIRAFFAPAYANGTDWWSMDVEFKFDALPGECPTLFVKQARPFGGSD